MRKLVMMLGAMALVAGGAQAATKKMAGAELLPMAKVSLDAARTAALAARPGQITDQELEKEAGGSGLRYSFDVLSHGKKYEVGVDAKTGKVLENAAEGKHPD